MPEEHPTRQWSEEDDFELRRSINSGTALETIAAILMRSLKKFVVDSVNVVRTTVNFFHEMSQRLFDLPSNYRLQKLT